MPRFEVLAVTRTCRRSSSCVLQMRRRRKTCSSSASTSTPVSQFQFSPVFFLPLSPDASVGKLGVLGFSPIDVQ